MPDNNIKQVNKVLLVGLGGTGSEIVNMVAEKVEADNNNIAFVTMDTDLHDIAKLKPGTQVVNVRTSTDEIISHYLPRIKGAEEWFPNVPLINGKSLQYGAGQMRVTSRLALNSAQNDNILGALRNAINKLHHVDGTNAVNIKVMVISSLAGGTGSGILLQVPAILKEMLQTVPGHSYLIRGLFIMPDIFKDYLADDVQKESIYANAYAVIKELNAVNEVCTTDADVPLGFEMNFEHFNSEEAHGDSLFLPYNLVFALDKTNEKGQVLTELDEIKKQARDIVRIQLFTPVSNRLFSTEDNRFYNLIQNNGRNIFGSAATARLVYPYDDIVDYVTTRKVQDFISYQWRKFDKVYADELNYYHIRQRTELNAKKPQLRNTIITQTENILKANSKDNPSFVFLKKDLFVEDDDNNLSKTNRVVQYYNNIKQYVTKLMTQDSEILSYIQKCTIDENGSKALRDKSTARNQILFIENNLTQYKNKIDSLAEESIPTGAINAIIATDVGNYNQVGTFEAFLETVKMFENGQYDVFNLLNKEERFIHPMSARYVFSKLIDMIEKDKKQNDAELKKVAQEIEEYATAYDNPETEDVIEEPENIIAEYATRFMGEHRREYKDFVETYENKSAAQRNLLNKYSKLKVYKAVFDVVLKRLKKFEEAYNALFTSLESIERDLEIQKEYLENKNIDNALTVFINASPEDKQRIYNETERTYKSSEDFETLVNQSINQSLFLEAAKAVSYEEEHEGLTSMSFTFEQEAMKDIFTDNVVRNSKKDIVKNVAAVLDKDVVTVLFEKAKDARSNVVDQTIIDDYLQSVYNRAIPLLNYHTAIVQPEPGNDTTFSKNSAYTLNYWGLNPRVEAKLSTFINPESPEDFLSNKESGQKSEISSSVSFSPYEMVCYNTTYGLKPDEISTIDDFEEVYNSRVRELNSNGVPLLGVSMGKESTITPHLDKRWHNTLPEISPERQKKKENTTDQLLLKALSYGFLKLLKDSSGNRSFYFFTDTDGGIPVRYHGYDLTPNHFTLLREKAHQDHFFINYSQEEIESKYKKDIQDVKNQAYQVGLDNAVLESIFVKQLAEPDVYGQNVLEYFQAMRVSEGGVSQQYTRLLENLDKLINEFATQVSPKGNEEIKESIRKKIKTQIFEKSPYFAAGPETIEYLNFSGWANK